MYRYGYIYIYIWGVPSEPELIYGKLATCVPSMFIFILSWYVCTLYSHHSSTKGLAACLPCLLSHAFIREACTACQVIVESYNDIRPWHGLKFTYRLTYRHDYVKQVTIPEIDHCGMRVVMKNMGSCTKGTYWHLLKSSRRALLALAIRRTASPQLSLETSD